MLTLFSCSSRGPLVANPANRFFVLLVSKTFRLLSGSTVSPLRPPSAPLLILLGADYDWGDAAVKLLIQPFPEKNFTDTLGLTPLPLVEFRTYVPV